MSLEVPEVSVDRTIHSYFDSFDIDLNSIADFYNALPFEEKSPLDECKIHFSGLANVNGPEIGLGVHMHNPELANKQDTTVDTANIIIFIGSILKKENSDVTTSINEVVAHELVHYAQKDKDGDRVFSEEERLLKAKLMLSRGIFPKIGFVLSSACYFGIDEFLNNEIKDGFSTIDSVGIGVGFATIRSLVLRKRHKKEALGTQRKLFEIGRENSAEQLANDHAHLEAGVTIGNMKNFDERMIPTVARTNSTLIRLQHSAHESLSLRSY